MTYKRQLLTTMLIKPIKNFESKPLESLLVPKPWVQHLSRQNCNYISAHGDVTSVRGLELPSNTYSLYKTQWCLPHTT